jgi:hypothetical protein
MAYSISLGWFRLTPGGSTAPIAREPRAYQRTTIELLTR